MDFVFVWALGARRPLFGFKYEMYRMKGGGNLVCAFVCLYARADTFTVDGVYFLKQGIKETVFITFLELL